MKLNLFTGLLAALLGFVPVHVHDNQTPSLAKFFKNEPVVRMQGDKMVSANWSGYIADKGKFTGVQGSWTVPKVSSSRSIKTDSTWVGIGGVVSSDLIQAGTEALTGVPGKVGYQAWIEMLPGFANIIPVQINSGDLVSVEIKQAAGSKWLINFKNISTGQNFMKTVDYHSSLSSAEWIEEMPSNANYQLIPLDNFRQVRFANAYAIKNNRTVSISSAGGNAVLMENSLGKILAAPGLLQESGTAFDVKRLK